MKSDDKVLLDEIVALMPGHVYWKDPDGVYLGCNDLQARTLGYKSGKDIVGKTDYDLPWKDEADALRAQDKHIMQTQKASSLEEPATLPNGKQAIFLSKKVPLITKSKKVIGILGVSFDITEQKELEANLKKAKQAAEYLAFAKSEFIANVSHDLRTPLGAVSGITELLKNVDNEQVQFLVPKLEISCKRMLDLVDEVLTYSKLEQQETKINLQPLGCAIELAHTKSEAMSKPHHDFDVILMDVGLGNESGLDVVRYIRAEEKEKSLKRQFIAALTARAHDHDKEMCFDAGVDAFLSKPVTGAQLAELLAKQFLKSP